MNSSTQASSDTRLLSLLVIVSVASVLVGMNSRAEAQIPEVLPDGNLSNPAAPPPTPAPVAPAPIVIGADGQQIEQQGSGDDDGFYFNDGSNGAVGLGTFGSGSQPLFTGGTVPPSHVVRRGDTLWDITWFYFNNPFNWPKVWSYNPEISNPHWIYPGDQVRLYKDGEAPSSNTSSNTTVGIGQPDVDNTTASGNRPATSIGEFSLRQVAFVSEDKLEFSATIDGSTDEKIMLSLGDGVYLSYPSDKPPKVGKRFAIYQKRKSVKHPKSGKTVGSYVRVIGELEIVSVKEGKRARAIITDSTDVIERGARVGPLQRQFKSVKPVDNEVDAQGTIVAQLFADELIGATQVVSIDLGKDSGVKIGNRLFVIRRGDGYVDLGGQISNSGQNDKRFPARAIGEVIVVEAGKTSSLCLVTLATQEIGISDRVLMRKAR